MSAQLGQISGSNPGAESSSMGMKFALATVVAVLVALIATIVWAALESSVAVGLQQLWSERWGVATLTDLCAGLLFGATWIGALVGVRRALPWWIAMLLLGNVPLLVFLILRWGSVRTITAWILPRESPSDAAPHEQD